MVTAKEIQDAIGSNFIELGTTSAPADIEDPKFNLFTLSKRSDGTRITIQMGVMTQAQEDNIIALGGFDTLIVTPFAGSSVVTNTVASRTKDNFWDSLVKFGFIGGPPPPTTRIIDGVEIFPDQEYIATFFDISLNQFTSSGLTKGSDIITLFDLGKFIITINNPVDIPPPNGEPQNPFYRDASGTKIFVNGVTIL